MIERRKGELKLCQTDLAEANRLANLERELQSLGIPVGYSNVFWGGRSEIKPSKIAPAAYRQFCRENGLDPDAMRG